MTSAVRSASADNVSVGLVVPTVRNVPLPTKFALSLSADRPEPRTSRSKNARSRRKKSNRNH